VGNNVALSFQQELMLHNSNDIASSGMDPFLSGLAEHSRQESADSGLGLGNSYSLPHTPDFFSTLEDNMDGVSGKYRQRYTLKIECLLESSGSCHKRQKPQAPIRNRQTRKVANAKGLNRDTNRT